MAKLVINPTSASKKEIPIVARVISIGRDPSNDLVLSDSMVSRRHAILEQRDDRYVLRDNNSSNGTLVNGDRVSDEQTLRDGDLVAIGSARLLFRLDEAVESSLSDLPLGSDSGDASSIPGMSIGFERRCPTCGKVTLPEDRFCRGCGAGLAAGSARKPCPSCGQEVLLPADFCGSCGKPLQTAMAADLSTRPHRLEDLALRSPAPSSEPSKDAERASAPVPPARRPVKRARAREENAGFGLRLVAGLIDVLILGIPVLVFGLVWATLSMDASGESRGGSSSLLPAAALGLGLLAFFYFFSFWALRGATPGASLVGLVVRTDAGVTPIGPARAALRTFAGLLGLLPLGLGFLWVVLSKENVSWHDRISGTRVKRSA